MMLKRSSILLPLFTTRNLSRYAHRLASSFMIPNDKRYTNKNNGLRARYKYKITFPGAEGCYNEKGRHLHQHPLMTCIMKLGYIQHIKSNNIYKSNKYVILCGYGSEPILPYFGGETEAGEAQLKPSDENPRVGLSHQTASGT